MKTCQTYKKIYYQKRKEQARRQAIEWQHNFGYYCGDSLDVATWTEHWHKIGKRYGLLKEFKENGIL